MESVFDRCAMLWHSGNSARFDELLQEIRLLWVRRNPGKVLDNLEERMLAETASIMLRFSTALAEIDTREKIGYRYQPRPLDTSSCVLPPSVQEVSELIAENCHDVWAAGRIADGWQWGAHRDNEAKLHPDLIPYSMLTEETKQYDRDTANETLRAIVKFGFDIVRDETVYVEPHQFGVPVPHGETYTPVPVDTTGITLERSVVQLGELLAANTHDVWSRNRMSQGWTYGPKRDDAQKKHNCLVPYAFLTNKVPRAPRAPRAPPAACRTRCSPCAPAVRLSRRSKSTTATRRWRR